jgi:hypothetical protein
MTWQHTREVALAAALVAVLLLLFAHIDYYLRHGQWG